MAEETSTMRFLKWAGIALLVVVPLLVILKKLGTREESPRYDEGDIFSAELDD